MHLTSIQTEKKRKKKEKISNKKYLSWKYFAIDFVVAVRHRQLYSSTHIHISDHYVFVLRRDKTCFPPAQHRRVESLWFFLKLFYETDTKPRNPFILPTTVFVFFFAGKKINLSTMYFESEFKYAVIIDLVTTSWSYQNFSNADAIDRQEIIGEWKILIIFSFFF